MNIVEHFHQLALKAIEEKIATWREFIEAETFTITTKCGILSPEIIALGGYLEKWETDESGKYYLTFDTQNPLTTNCVIGRHADAMFFISTIKGDQYILKVSDQDHISLVQLESLPEEITKRLERLAVYNITYAAYAAMGR